MVWNWIPLVVGGTVGAIGGFIVAGPFGAGAGATAGAALAYGSTGRKGPIPPYASEMPSPDDRKLDK
jgi:hypothetical protein